MSRVTFETENYENANYMNKNHHVKMPVFSIHGNHDSPIGLDLLSSIDQRSTNSYLNYFGKVYDIGDIKVEPVLLTKGRTKIALYGIGHITETRLNIALENGRI